MLKKTVLTFAFLTILTTFYGFNAQFSTPVTDDMLLNDDAADFGNSLLGEGDYVISAYDNVIRNISEKEGHDWRLMSAIAYHESRFTPDITSRSGARGLMQITEETFDWIKLKIAPSEDLTFDDLYDPETNIRFGTYFVSYCLLRYHDDLATAAAAYHSGWGTVDNLLSQAEYSSDGETLDHYPYPQMRLYVRKITNSYQRYQDIYNEK